MKSLRSANKKRPFSCFISKEISDEMSSSNVNKPHLIENKFDLELLQQHRLGIPIFQE